MSIQLAMVKKQMKGAGQSFGADFDVEQVRKSAESSGQMPPVKGVEFADIVLGGRETDVAIPQKQMRDDAVILYIHGGGFVSGDPKYVRSFTSYLAKTAKMKVYGITYRLAPEFPFPAGPNDCIDAYKALIEKESEKKIYLLGESGGATLVIVTTLMARDQGIRLPDAVAAYAPCGDVSGRIDRFPYKDTDLVVGYGAIDTLRKFYCPNEDEAENPYVSPCLADYKGFPPLRLVWDKGEAFSADSREIAEKAKAAGVVTETKEWEGTFHTFEMLASLIPEAAKEVKDTVRFFEQCE